MELTCKQCGAAFRAAVNGPLAQAVRVACPACKKAMLLRPANTATPHPPRPSNPVGDAPRRTSPGTTEVPRRTAPGTISRTGAPRRTAVIADEPREFRNFIGKELEKLGFDVAYFDTGDAALEHVRRVRAELVILNVYLKGKLGVEISEEIKKDETLSRTRVVLIGALFRANRFRANPTNLYGADEYIEEQIPAKELHQIVRGLFPDLPGGHEREHEPKEFDEAKRLARLILSDIIIYNAEKVERGIRDGNFFDVLKTEIDDGREYYESRVPFKVRQRTEYFNETLQQFVQMKREELDRLRASGGSA